MKIDINHRNLGGIFQEIKGLIKGLRTTIVPSLGLLGASDCHEYKSAVVSKMFIKLLKFMASFSSWISDVDEICCIFRGINNFISFWAINHFEKIGRPCLKFKRQMAAWPLAFPQGRSCLVVVGVGCHFLRCHWGRRPKAFGKSTHLF